MDFNPPSGGQGGHFGERGLGAVSGKRETGLIRLGIYGVYISFFFLWI